RNERAGRLITSQNHLRVVNGSTAFRRRNVVVVAPFEKVGAFNPYRLFRKVHAAVYQDFRFAGYFEGFVIKLYLLYGSVTVIKGFILRGFAVIKNIGFAIYKANGRIYSAHFRQFYRIRPGTGRVRGGYHKIPPSY